MLQRLKKIARAGKKLPATDWTISMAKPAISVDAPGVHDVATLVPSRLLLLSDEIPNLTE